MSAETNNELSASVRALLDAAIIRHGFVRVRIEPELNQIGQRPSKLERSPLHDRTVWRRRIHDIIWLNIDEHGFVTLEQGTETGAAKLSKITIPHPVRTVEDFDHLMRFML